MARKQHSISKLKYLTPIEVVELKEKIDRTQSQQVRDARPQEYLNSLMFELLLRTGMRSSELLLLRPRDLQLETLSICVATVKGGKDRELPLPTKLFRRFEDIAKGFEKDQAIFDIQQARI